MERCEKNIKLMYANTKIRYIGELKGLFQVGVESYFLLQ